MHNAVRRARRHVADARATEHYAARLLESREIRGAAIELGEARWDWVCAVALLVEWAQT